MRRATAVLTVGVMGVCVMGARFASAQTISVQPTELKPMSLRLASLTPTQGFEALALGSKDTIYVAPRVALPGGAVVSAVAIESSDGTDIELSLTADGVRWLGSAMRKSGADQVAIFSAGELIGVGELQLDAAGARAVVSGLSTTQVDQIMGLIDAHPVRAIMSLVPVQSRVQPGEAVSVDIFVSGVADLRTYQVTLEVRGGQSGTMVLEDLQVDTSRSDYVFGTLQKLDAVDLNGSRIGSVLFNGGVDATSQSYLGTATLRASTDATGKFRIGTRPGNRTSLLWTSQNEPVAFAIRPAVVSIGRRSRPTATDR